MSLISSYGNFAPDNSNSSFGVNHSFAMSHFNPSFSMFPPKDPSNGTGCIRPRSMGDDDVPLSQRSSMVAQTKVFQHDEFWPIKGTGTFPPSPTIPPWTPLPEGYQPFGLALAVQNSQRSSGTLQGLQCCGVGMPLPFHVPDIHIDTHIPTHIILPEQGKMA